MIKASSPDQSLGTPRSRFKANRAGAPQVSGLKMRGAASALPVGSKPINGSRPSIAANLRVLRSESAHTSPLFAGFSELVSASFSFCAGGEIFGEGEEATLIYKLVKGAVRVGKNLSGGQRHINSFHLPGEYSGSSVP
jgi:hypothetical protein